MESAPPEQATTQAVELKERPSSCVANLPIPRQKRAHLGGSSWSLGSDDIAVREALRLDGDVQVADEIVEKGDDVFTLGWGGVHDALTTQLVLSAHQQFKL